MKRGIVLGTLMVVGALSLAVSGFQAPPAGPAAKALAATKIEKVKNNLYILTGSGAADTTAFSGGNSAAFITDGGVVIVDTKLAGWGQVILDLYYFGAGHTNGDSFVVFPALRTVHVGDMFAWKALPLIDTANGGRVVAHPQTLAKAIATINNVDTVINGHIPVSSWSDLKEYADFSREFVAWGENEMKAGKSVDQAAAEYKIAARYEGYVPSVNPQFGGVKTNLEMLYNELKRK
jgi:glyoxylase-like metal-dependent hydrolase (beta-lactamase superfamily II)